MQAVPAKTCLKSQLSNSWSWDVNPVRLALASLLESEQFWGRPQPCPPSHPRRSSKQPRGLRRWHGNVTGQPDPFSRLQILPTNHLSSSSCSHSPAQAGSTAA